MIQQCEGVCLRSEEPGFLGTSGEMDSSGAFGSGYVAMSCCISVPVLPFLLVSLLFLFSSDSALSLTLLLAGLCVVASALIFCSLSLSWCFLMEFSCPWYWHVK